MATNLKFQSPVDPESFVLVSKENNWQNIKVYAGGSLQYEAKDGDDLRTGRKIEIDGFGILELYLKKDLEVTVSGTAYKALNTDAEEKVTNVSAIFWVLTLFSGIGLVLLFLISSRLYRDVFIPLMIMQVFSILIYGTTAILLMRKIYWFYFVGAAVFTLFTAMEFLDIDMILSSAIVMVRVIVRLALLFLLFRILPTILKLMRKPNSDDLSDTILDQQ